MPFNGSGTFNRVYNWEDDAANGIKIRADRMDTEDDGFATGLSTCVTRDGQSPATANLPMGGYKHTGVADGSSATDYSSLKQSQQQVATFAAAGGTADAITAGYVPTVTALVDGMTLYVRAAYANATTTPTFAPDGLTAHTITKLGGVALIAGDIYGAGHEMILRYRASATRWELLNPATIGGVSVSVDDSTFRIQNTSDNTKKIAFSAAGITTGNTRTFTAPDVSGTLTILDATQTLTNKTISGSSNTLSNIANSSLTNSSITIAGHTVSLGGTQALAASDLSNGVTGSGAVVLATGGTIAGAEITSQLNMANTISYAARDNGGTARSIAYVNTSNSLVIGDPGLSGVSILGTTTIGNGLVYGGVTLANSVTGTGSMVLSANQTLTGTTTMANATVSGYLNGVSGLTLRGDAASSNYISITTAGLMGFNTTPSYPIHVERSSNDTLTRIWTYNGSGGGSAEAILGAQNASGSIMEMSMLGPFAGSGSLFGNDTGYVYSTGTGGMSVVTGGSYPLRLGTNSNERMQISGGGSVLVNTTTAFGWTGSGQFESYAASGHAVSGWAYGGSGNNAIMGRVDTTGNYLFRGYYGSTAVASLTADGTGSTLSGPTLKLSSSAALTLNGTSIPFQISGTQKGVVDASGRLLWGTTSPWATEVNSEFRHTSTAGSFYNSGSVSGTAAAYFRVDSVTPELQSYFYGGSSVGGITTNGSSVSYNTTSDQTLKTDLGVASNDNFFDQFDVHTVIWKDGVDTRPFNTVFAQDIQPLRPHLVTQRADGKLMMDYIGLIPDMLSELQLHRRALKDLGKIAA